MDNGTHLMDLPIELQVLTLEFYLVSPSRVSLNWTWAYDPSRNPKRFQRAFVTEPYRIDTSILRTNHHFHTLGRRVLYGKNFFDFKQECFWQKRYGFKPQTHVAQGFRDMIGSHNAYHICRVRVIANEQHKIRASYNTLHNSLYNLDRMQDAMAIITIRTLCQCFENVQYLVIRFNLAKDYFETLLGQLSFWNLVNVRNIHLFVRHRGQLSSYESLHDAPEVTAALASYGWKFENYVDVLPYSFPVRRGNLGNRTLQVNYYYHYGAQYSRIKW